MFDRLSIPPVDHTEGLARYILNRRNIRANNTVKPDEFIPYKWVALSVNRLRECCESEVWMFGNQVAEQRDLPLLGRVDLSVESCSIEPLFVVAEPLDDNPNHADIRGYPSDKAEQKALALKIAKKASEVIPCDSNSTR